MTQHTTAMTPIQGYFVDWNGHVRQVSKPGAGFKCVSGVDARFVEVLGSDGGVIHEADLWLSLDDLKAAGIPIKLIDREPTFRPAGTCNGTPA
ncbi:hypothetical protein [Pseudomonas sp. NPDC089569]|uniref:hypothetical protein n=1 Tax=Pseudomonas sp. NPDC089569 TaxID=3390722 RepID=UPI003D07703D